MQAKKSLPIRRPLVKATPEGPRSGRTCAPETPGGAGLWRARASRRSAQGAASASPSAQGGACALSACVRPGKGVGGPEESLAGWPHPRCLGAGPQRPVVYLPLGGTSVPCLAAQPRRLLSPLASSARQSCCCGRHCSHGGFSDSCAIAWQVGTRAAPRPQAGSTRPRLLTPGVGFVLLRDRENHSARSPPPSKTKSLLSQRQCFGDKYAYLNTFCYHLCYLLSTITFIQGTRYRNGFGGNKVKLPQDVPFCIQIILS